MRKVSYRLSELTLNSFAANTTLWHSFIKEPCMSNTLKLVTKELLYIFNFWSFSCNACSLLVLYIQIYPPEVILYKFIGIFKCKDALLFDGHDLINVPSWEYCKISVARFLFAKLAADLSILETEVPPEVEL